MLRGSSSDFGTDRLTAESVDGGIVKANVRARVEVTSTAASDLLRLLSDARALRGLNWPPNAASRINTRAGMMT